MVFCNQCGSKNPEDANFCSSCGYTINKPFKSSENQIGFNSQSTNSNLEDSSDDIEDRHVCIYKDTDLNPPPIRNGVTGVIGTIWFFGMLILFGIGGFILSLFIGVIVFIALVVGLRTGFFPTEWSVPYFEVTCPNCHAQFPFFMNDSIEEYHPEGNHTYDDKCDSCDCLLTIDYIDTGSYDARWDKFR